MPGHIMEHFQENIEGISRKVTDFDMRLRRVESMNIASFEMQIAICRRLDIPVPLSALKVEAALSAMKPPPVTETATIQQEGKQDAA
jgi:hypothetical protein